MFYFEWFMNKSIIKRLCSHKKSSISLHSLCIIMFINVKYVQYNVVNDGDTQNNTKRIKNNRWRILGDNYEM